MSEGAQEPTLQSPECTERETEAPSGAHLLKVLQRGEAELGSCPQNKPGRLTDSPDSPDELFSQPHTQVSFRDSN